MVVGILFFQKVIDMFFGGTMETRKELGVTTMEKLQNITNTTQFKMLDFQFKDVTGGMTKGIQDNLGGVSQVTQETVTGFIIKANFGVSGETNKVNATIGYRFKGGW